jgi:hypothetical protein
MNAKSRDNEKHHDPGNSAEKIAPQTAQGPLEGFGAIQSGHHGQPRDVGENHPQRGEKSQRIKATHAAW